VIYISAAVCASEWRSGVRPALIDQLASARVAVATMASASAGVNPARPVALRYIAAPKMRSRARGRRRDVPRCAVDRGLDLRSLLQFPTHRWYKGNY
jgi:hypothetical protein